MKLFKHHVPRVVIIMALIDFVLLLVAADAAWALRTRQIGIAIGPLSDRMTGLVSFATAFHLAVTTSGIYASESIQSPRFASARLLVAVAFGVVFLAIAYFVFPGATLWRSMAAYAIVIGYLLLVLARLVFGRLIDGNLLKRRVLVLGAGERAERLARLAEAKGARFRVVEHVDIGDAPRIVAGATPRASIANLADHVATLGVTEVVLALEERRNAFPLGDLLRVRTAGVSVIEISSFLERETGRVDLRSVSPSWLILSDGFSGGRTFAILAKRAFDIAASLLLLVATLPLILLATLLVKLDTRGPALFRQTRIGLFGEPFDLVKIRSMRVGAEAAGEPVWAAADDPRVTRVGRLLRMTRIDELPQLWTVLKGRMSFVGPRPERPTFVTALEQQIPYYAVRHMMKPGITGWAQVNYPYARNSEDARHKLEYDLYYVKNYTPFLDLVVILQTVRVILFAGAAA